MVGVSSLAGDTLQKNLYILVKENLPCFMGKKTFSHTRVFANKVSNNG
jgi:hypothetical protein